MTQAGSQIMGFSPKILVALIALGLLATGSIVFNVYLLATKDKALRTEVEGLRESKTKLDKDLGYLRANNVYLTNELSSGARQYLPVEREELLRGGSRGGMQIFVESPNGEKTITLEVEKGDTIYAVKEKITTQMGGNPIMWKLILAGKELENGRTLSDYEIKTGLTLKLDFGSTPYRPPA